MSKDDDLTIHEHYLNEIKKNLKEKKNNKTKKSHKSNHRQKETEDLLAKKLDSEVKEDAASNARKPIEVVVFKTKKTTLTAIEKHETKTSNLNEKLSKKFLSDLQWDVSSFGLEGFSKEEKRKLEQERAVKLGARPKKREYVNYKVLMEQRKQEKLANSQKKDQNKTSRNRPDKNSTMFWNESKSTKRFGQVGKFKNGVLSLSRTDIKSVK